MRITTIEPQLPEGATTAMLADVAPLTSEKTIALQNGCTGEVSVESKVITQTRSFVAIHVRLRHRYGKYAKFHYYEKLHGQGIAEVEEKQVSSKRLEQVRRAWK